MSLIVLCEHRVSQDREKLIINKSLPDWELCTNANTNVRGRLWVIWNSKKISFKKVAETEQYIHELVGIYNKQFQFTIVYGLHTISARILLWLIMGDFNSILGHEDIIVGTKFKM